MKNKILSFFGAFCLALTFTVSAHAIESYDWGPQDADFPHSTGITHSEYNLGLNFPSFNNYIDNNSEQEGIADEREFLVGKNISTSSPEDEYENIVPAKAGDVILVTGFLHNNGAENNEKTIARDTKTGMEGIEKKGDFYETNTNIRIRLQQFITSSNTDPDRVWDTFTVVSENDEPVRLRYIGSLSIIPNVGGEYLALNEEEFFTEEGTAIGLPDAPESGVIPGGIQNAMHTFAYFQVVEAPDADTFVRPQSNDQIIPNCSSCQDASVTKSVSSDGKSYNSYAFIEHNGYAYYKITVNNNCSRTKNIVIQDSLGSPDKSGSLGAIESESISCDYADCSGSLANGGKITISNLKEWKSVTITYKRKANAIGVPLGEYSKIPDTVKMTGDSTGSSTATTKVKGTQTVVEEPICPDAEIKIPVDLFVVGEGCYNNQFVDTEIVNITDPGNYELIGYTERGQLNQCQTNEEYFVNINGVDGPVTKDDADPCMISKRNDFLGTFPLEIGDNQVKMTSSRSCPPDTEANSVHLKYICFTPIREPDFNIVKKVSVDGQTYLKSAKFKNEDTVYYKIYISNDGDAVGSVKLSDVLGAASNGGSLGPVQNEVITCAQGASCNGSVLNGISIANLAQGQSVSITYERKAVADGIPAQQESSIINTASLDDAEGTSDTAEVIIISDEFTWDKSSLQVTGKCQDDSADFLITNTGENMKGPVEYRIFRNNVLEEKNQLQLTAQEQKQVIVEAGLDAIRLEVDQRLGHPGSSLPQETVSGCGEEPDFRLDKRVWKGASWGENANVIDGGIAYYRIAVENTGKIPGDFVLRDLLSSPTNGGSLGQIFNEDLACPLGATCDGSLVGSGITVKGIPAGDFFVIDYQRVADNSAIPVGETSTVTDTASVNTGQNDTANVVITGEGPVPAIQVQKSVSANGVDYRESITRNNGETAYYKISVQNTGNAPGSVIITDTLSTPSNGGSLSGITNEVVECGNADCSGSLNDSGIDIQNLPVGDTITITYQRKASNSGIPEGMNSVITDTASISTGDSDTANVTIRQSDVYPSFSVEKTVSSGGDFTENITLADGQKAIYRVVVQNTGSGAGDVTVKDVLSTPTNGGGLSGVANEDIQCGSATCSGTLSGQGITIQNLAPNASVTITYTRTASMMGIPPGKNSVIVDSARLSSGDSNEASVTIVGPVATPTCSNFISIPPSVDPNTPFTLNWNASSQRSFIIERSNSPITPYLQNGVETSFEISDGISDKTDFSLIVYNGPDQTGDKVECPTITVPINKPSFQIDKLISKNGIDFGYERVDLQDGESAYYAIVVQNTGTFTGTIGITDVMDSGTNGGSLTLNGPALATPPGICSSGNIYNADDPLLCTLKPNGTVTITYSKTAHSDTIEPGSHSDFINTAELLPTGQTSQAEVRVQGPKVAADLAVYLSVDDDNIAPNSNGVTQELTYTALWYNFGNVNMDKATVTVQCDADAIAKITTPVKITTLTNQTEVTFGPFNTEPGDEGIFTFKAELKDGFGDPAEGFTCTAHIESADFLPIADKEINAKNNDDFHEVWVDPKNDDQRFKHVLNTRTGISGTKVSASAGDELVYTLGYRAGDSDVNGFVFEDDITDILEYAELTDAGEGNYANGTIKWSPVNINAYETKEVTFTVRVFDDLIGLAGDYEMTNMFGQDEVIVPLPNIHLSKTVQVNNGEKKEIVNAKAGDIITYTLYAENTGKADKEGFVFADDIADVLEVADVIDLGGGELNGTVISWLEDDILAGETAERSFQVQIHTDIGEDEDCVLENIYGNKTVVNIPHIVEIKTVINERTGEKGVSIQAEAGDEIVYVLTVEEVGDQGDQEDYVFVDNVVDTLEYADISNISHGGVLDATTGVITWPAADINKGETVDRTFSATIKPESEWPSVGDFELTNIFGNLTTITVGKIVVDTQVVKTVSKDELAPTMEAVYTLTYKNNGDRIATNAFINDDFDETKITIKEDENGNPILPVNCIITETPALTNPIGGPQYIQCQLDDIPANSGAFSISYTAVVLEDAAGSVENTATIGQDQVDKDPSNNKSFTRTPVNTGGLVITKSVSPQSVTTGQKADYTVRVTNSSPIKKTFTLSDVQTEGNNKGSLSFNNSSSSISFDPEGSGTAAGTFANGGKVIITDLDPGASVTITYNKTASNEEIPFNQSSMFENTATIEETGMNAKAQTFVVGPTRGGGGGGGGGGSRRVTNSLNLYIEKEVQDNQGKWHDADTFDLAAVIDTKKSQDVEYRIKITNEGSQTGKNIIIKDEFTSTTIKRNAIKNVEGAEWDADEQVFTIKEIGSGKTATIRYAANLELLGDFHKLASGKNTATITDAEVLSSGSALIRSRTATVKGIGGNDPAFVKTEIDDKIMLQKTVDKKVVKPGEEAEFRIIVHNRGKMDYENLTITDNFAFQFLDLVQANDLRNIDKENQTLTFTKRSLKANDIWIIKLKVKVKNSVPGNTKVRNSVTITAENADLTGLYAYAEIIVTPLPQPEVLIKTGITGWQIALILLGFVTIAFGGRQLRRKS